MKVWIVTAIPPFTYQNRYTYAVTYTEETARIKAKEAQEHSYDEIVIEEYEVI